MESECPQQITIPDSGRQQQGVMGRRSLPVRLQGVADSVISGWKWKSKTGSGTAGKNGKMGLRVAGDAKHIINSMLLTSC